MARGITYFCRECVRSGAVCLRDEPTAPRCGWCGAEVRVGPATQTLGPEDWDAESCPTTLTQWLWALSPWPSDRSFRLAACAVGRRLLERKDEAALRRAVECGEAMADGRWPAPDTCDDIRRGLRRFGRWRLRRPSTEVVLGQACIDRRPILEREFVILTGTPTDILRDIFPNPFLPIDWRVDWRTSAVRDLARSIYAGREFGLMPILADALLEAGCDNPVVLDHCRSDRPHVRGCWVVDGLLGKG